MDPTLALIFASLLIGLSKGGLTGPAAGGIVLFLLSQTMSVSQATGLTLPLLIFADLFAMGAYWKRWDMRHIRLLLPTAIVGIVFGTLLLASLSNDLLKILLGLFSIVVVAYKIASDSLKQLEYSPRHWHGLFAGWLAGFASAIANSGGPPIAAYLLLQKLPPVTFAATSALFFFVVNLLKVPGYISLGILDINHMIQIAWTLPLIPFGVWFGRWVIERIDRRPFEWLMMILLLYAAIRLIFG